MSDEPHKELVSTYFVADRTSNDERTRVQIQDNMLTKAMGGVLPEQLDPARFQRIIDIGCGTGGWLIEMAKKYPTIHLLVGADISIHMVKYARKHAKKEHVSDRIEFHVIDALRMREFPEHSFDLVNQRLGWSYLRTWDWPPLLQKYQYIARRGGTVRITESDIFGITNSPALTTLSDLARNALYNAGHMFTPERDGLTRELPDLLQRFGFKERGRRAIILHHAHGTETMETFCEDIQLLFRTLLPFLRKWTRVPDTYDDLYKQALHEMQDPGFTADWEVVTVWGENP